MLPDQRPNWVRRVESITIWVLARSVGASSIAEVRARKTSSQAIRPGLGATRSRSVRSGSITSTATGPTRVSLRSTGASREAWIESCRPSTTTLKEASITRRFG